MKTSHLILLGGIGLLALNSPQILQSQQQDAALRATRNATKQVERQIREQSRVALTRYQGNCIRVVDARSKLETQLMDGQPVVDPATGFPVTDGAYICNKQGDSAIAQNGAATQIQRVATDDLTKLKPILEANERARTRAGVW